MNTMWINNPISQLASRAGLNLLHIWASAHFRWLDAIHSHPDGSPTIGLLYICTKVDNEIMKMSYCVPRVNILTNENLNTYSTEFKRCLINSRNYLFPAIWNHCNTIFDLCVSVNVNTYFKLETYRFSLLKYLMGQFARLFFLTTYEVISLNY